MVVAGMHHPQDRNALILLAVVGLVVAVIGLVAFLSTRVGRGADPEFWGHDATPWYLDLLGALSGLRENREQERRRRGNSAVLREREREKAEFLAVEAAGVRGEADALITRLGEELAGVPTVDVAGAGMVEFEEFMGAYDALKRANARAESVAEARNVRSEARDALELLRLWCEDRREQRPEQ
ncbi:hypothetical protein DFP74_1772 [Nocardiopsis sp. Huas11]|uniref:hypothetical protein n=1 Tax=Nocardiopsis sp. Huas11 TaxID=2183912 RepID=UPI000EAFC853|nr:hypothetical protein [Nocardiopsis sp. Huas11]RKS06148.1 hypothetical protein DFP74_1772 [Nocardiopsis sp. Huas11]